MEKYKEKYSTLKYIQIDVRQMSSFEKWTFDAIIYKNKLDSILSGDSSVSNS